MYRYLHGSKGQNPITDNNKGKLILACKRALKVKCHNFRAPY